MRIVRTHTFILWGFCFHQKSNSCAPARRRLNGMKNERDGKIITMMINRTEQSNSITKLNRLKAFIVNATNTSIHCTLTSIHIHVYREISPNWKLNSREFSMLCWWIDQTTYGLSYYVPTEIIPFTNPPPPLQPSIRTLGWFPIDLSFGTVNLHLLCIN